MSPARRLRRRNTLTIWHRRLGLTAALFVLLLATTGLALNHTDGLRLDERYVGAGWLLRWYGIEAPDQAVSFQAGESTITRLGERLYLGALPVEDHADRLIGAVSSDGFVIVALDGALLMLTTAGDRIERLGREDGIPAGVQAVGLAGDGRIVLDAGDGVYRADAQLLAWERLHEESTGLRWSAPAAPDPALLSDLQEDYLANILTLERVILDLHSGRIFGRHGPWLMDGAAILLLVLAVTGVWLWSGLRPKRG